MGFFFDTYQINFLNMKNFYFTSLVLTLSLGFFSQQATAQAPQSMSYQSVIRNSSNVLLANTAVGIKISVLQGNLDGIAVYTETQTATTNANGLLSLQIGTGSPTIGTFSQIDWANGPYFIKTETDPTGGSNYTIVGTQQLASVPYALYAAKSGDATTMGAISDSPSANGGTITNGALSLAPADATNGGVVTTGDQTFAGAKTFSNDAKINGVTVGAGGLGSSWYDLAVGYSALLNNTTGYGNTALGASTLSLNTGGSDNTAVGNGALQQNTSGYRNTVIGASAQRDNTNGYYNTATGFNALMLNISGSNNTANGSYALLTNTTGSNNSAFGNEADVATGDLSNATAIGAGAIVDASNKIQLGNSAITSVNTSGTYTGAGFKTPNGTSSQFLMADGSVSTGATGPQGPAGATGSVGSVTAIAGTSNANGATISDGNLTLTPADATNGGIVTNSAQTFAGNKTFTGTATANSFVKAGGTASQYLMANGSSSSIIRGTVAASGTVSNGTGFFIGSILQSGIYPIAFNTPFTTIPIVVATVQGSAGIISVSVSNVTTTGFRVYTSTSSTLINSTFSFIAMAP